MLFEHIDEATCCRKYALTNKTISGWVAGAGEMGGVCRMWQASKDVGVAVSRVRCACVCECAA